MDVTKIMRIVPWICVGCLLVGLVVGYRSVQPQMIVPQTTEQPSTGTMLSRTEPKDAQHQLAPLVDSNKGTKMDESASLPIWEDIVAPNPQQPPSGRRIYPDGRLFEYSDVKISIDLKSGKTRTVPRPLDWYLVTTLSAEKVSRLAKLLNETEFFSFPAALDLASPVSDGTTWTLHARLPGKERTISVSGYPANQPAALVHLVDQITQLTAPIP